MLARTYDWPLSKADKKDMLVRTTMRDMRQLENHHREVTETSTISSPNPSRGGRTILHGWEPCSEPSSTPSQLEPEAAVICTPGRLSLESDVSLSEVSSTQAWSDEGVKQTLESLQEEMARQQQKQFEAFQKVQQQQLQEFLARFQAQGLESHHEKHSSDHERLERNSHHSCPARSQHTTPPRPALKCRSRGGSLGGNVQRVRFVEPQSSSSSDEESDLKTKSAVARGRSRRVSRGPDGRVYNVPDETEEDMSQTASQPAGDYTKAAAGSVAGGALGLGGGLVGGAVAGLPLALLTFGLSIPIGAAVGGGLGCSVGAGAGAFVGYRSGTPRSQSNVQTSEAKVPEELEETKE